MLYVKKKKGRMDRDVGERGEEELVAQTGSQSYAWGFYDSGVIAGELPAVKARKTLLTDPNFLENQGSGAVPVKKRSASEEFWRGFGIGTRGIVHGISNVADPLRQGMNGVNALLGGDPNYFPAVGDKVGDWLGLPKPETRMEEVIHSVNSAAGNAGVGIGGATLMAKTAAKAPLNFYPTMARSSPAPLAQKVAGGESVAEQLAAKPGTQLIGDMAGEVATQLTQLAGAHPLVGTAMALAGAGAAASGANAMSKNNFFCCQKWG